MASRLDVATLDVALDVQERLQAAGTARDPFDSAAEVFDGLRGVLGYEFASLAIWDPAAARHRTRINLGYPETDVAIVDELIHLDPGFLVQQSRARPLAMDRFSDTDLSGPVGLGVVRARKYRDGLTHCVRTADGQYWGYINLSTRGTALLDPNASPFLRLLGSAITRLSDSVVSSDARSRVRSGQALVCLRDDTEVRWLMAGEPRVFGDDDELVQVARKIATTILPGDRVHVASGRGLIAVGLTRQAGDSILTFTPTTSPAGLTNRELEVLAMIPRGASNRVIAEQLNVSETTVARHVEHILTKLHVPNRAVAAARAAEWRIHLPLRLG